MRKLSVLTVALVLALLGGPLGIPTAHAKEPKRCNGVIKGIHFYRQATWRWQDQHDRQRTVSRFQEKRPRACGYKRWIAELWRDRAASARAEFENWYQATYSKWRCIHEHEGSWNDSSNSTYDGGLQMDSEFQRSYGRAFVERWGRAYNWPTWAQLLAAERAYNSGRGYNPWPNTARVCGLL